MGVEPIDEDEVITKLTALNMGEDEAKLYIELIKNGPSRARTLSSLTGFSRSKVYRLLDTLVDEDIVSAGLSTPTVYTSRSPEALVERKLETLAREQEWTQNLRGELCDAISDLSRERPTGDEVHWAVLEGRMRIYQRLQQMIANASEKIRVLSNHAITTEPVPIVEETWLAARRRAEKGVTVRGLLDLSSDGWSGVIDPDGTPNLEVRQLPAQEPVHSVMVDDEEMLLWLVLEPATTPEADEVAIWTNAPGLLVHPRLVFHELWDKAERS